MSPVCYTNGGLLAGRFCSEHQLCLLHLFVGLTESTSWTFQVVSFNAILYGQILLRRGPAILLRELTQ